MCCVSVTFEELEQKKETQKQNVEQQSALEAAKTAAVAEGEDADRTEDTGEGGGGSEAEPAGAAAEGEEEGKQEAAAEEEEPEEEEPDVSNQFAIDMPKDSELSFLLFSANITSAVCLFISQNI